MNELLLFFFLKLKHIILPPQVGVNLHLHTMTSSIHSIYNGATKRSVQGVKLPIPIVSLLKQCISVYLLWRPQRAACQLIHHQAILLCIRLQVQVIYQ